MSYCDVTTLSQRASRQSTHACARLRKETSQLPPCGGSCADPATLHGDARACAQTSRWWGGAAHTAPGGWVGEISCSGWVGRTASASPKLNLYKKLSQLKRVRQSLHCAQSRPFHLYIINATCVLRFLGWQKKIRDASGEFARNGKPPI